MQFIDLLKVFASPQKRKLNRIVPDLERVKKFFEPIKSLSDAELCSKTKEFRQELDQGITLDEIMPQAFAVVREATHRVLGHKEKIFNPTTKKMVPFMAHYDVQILGGIAMHKGSIVEMKTGEGKTQTAVLPAYLHALVGKGVHVFTLNDYLAIRDAERIGNIFRFLGLTVGCLDNTEPSSPERRAAYECDITYGGFNEFGFDYLRDNMASSPEQCVQRELNYAIIDEVDNVLIDEARTPLIISGQVTRSDREYEELKPRVIKLVNAQNNLVQQIVSEAEEMLNQEGKEYECGLKMLIAKHGAPKNKRLAKLLKEPGVAKFMKQVETDFLRDRKLLEIDDQLYYTIDESGHNAELNEKGRALISGSTPEFFTVPDLAELIGKIDYNATLDDATKALQREEVHRLYAERSDRIHSINQLVRAYSVYEIDVDYVVQDGQIFIVDEFTGHILHGRRYSGGLHQALEAKEGVKVTVEQQTLATITFQNFFKLYKKISGMTCTAATEVAEFHELYMLDVVSIPTNHPMIRKDFNDEIYRTCREKFNSVVEEITELYKRGRPVLVGTKSIEKSEILSKLLSRGGIYHEVLNAKHHSHEAQIIAQAGRLGAVTITTESAGRGTDIVLGGNFEVLANNEFLKSGISPYEMSLDEKRRAYPRLFKELEEERKKVLDLGGLHVIATERHESRRIDEQFRCNAGRRGEPGSTKFFLSLDDDLMQIFGSERIASIMDQLGAEDGEVISHPLVSLSIGGAQKRVEARNFEIRKHLKEYDDVISHQRNEIYGLRQRILRGEDLKDEILDQVAGNLEDIIMSHTTIGKYPEDWALQPLCAELQTTFGITYRIVDNELSSKTQDALFDDVWKVVREHYHSKESRFGADTMRQFERAVFLMVIDNLWKDHLYEMDLLKDGVKYRAFGQRNPLHEYQREGLEMFDRLRTTISKEVTSYLFRLERVERSEPQKVDTYQTLHGDFDIYASTEQTQRVVPVAVAHPTGAVANRSDLVPYSIVKTGVEVGQNDPCPCGSGKKYKKCHGAT